MAEANKLITHGLSHFYFEATLMSFPYRLVRVRLHEKNGKLNEMPCHHKLEEYLDAYIKTAGIVNDREGPQESPALPRRHRGPHVRVVPWRV
jgi:hypothetical protein